MGVIDKTTYTLRCESCGISEESSILDKGSNWSGSNWQSGTEFKNFETSWKGSGKTEPELISAICKHCGHAAKAESRFVGI